MEQFVVYYRYGDNYLCEIFDSFSIEEARRTAEYELGFVTQIIFVEKLDEVKHQFVENEYGHKCFLLQ